MPECCHALAHPHVSLVVHIDDCLQEGFGRSEEFCLQESVESAFDLAERFFVMGLPRALFAYMAVRNGWILGMLVGKAFSVCL